ncbi:hypothetical protein [Streptomyces albiflavescens]|nr:hypothetical protein [Streptomyces albiflavescens]
MPVPKARLREWEVLRHGPPAHGIGYWAAGAVSDTYMDVSVLPVLLRG